MPSSSERVPNRPLSGAELKTLITADLERLISAEGLLSPHIAFGRVRYELSLTLHLDNAMRPQSTTVVVSRPPSVQALAVDESLAAIEGAPPLPDPSSEAIVSGNVLARTIDSPNAERLRAGLPIPVDRRQQDGTLITEHITYSPDPDAPPDSGHVEVVDTSDATRRLWHQPPALVPSAPPVPTSPNPKP